MTRSYFEQRLKTETGPQAADIQGILGSPPDGEAENRLSKNPGTNAMLHTTCVATRLEGGLANNALPQRAAATVNCRILPGHSPEEVRHVLMDGLADASLTVQYIDDVGQVRNTASGKTGNPPPALNPAVFKPLEQVAKALWPGRPVIRRCWWVSRTACTPMPRGCRRVAGIAIDADDVRPHGRDERLGVQSFYRGNEFFYRYLEALTAR